MKFGLIYEICRPDPECKDVISQVRTVGVA